MAYMVIATVNFLTPNQRTECLPLFVAHRERSLANEPGTLWFEFTLSKYDANQILLQEFYENEAAFDDHRNGASNKQIWTEGKALGLESVITGWEGITIN